MNGLQRLQRRVPRDVRGAGLGKLWFGIKRRRLPSRLSPPDHFLHFFRNLDPVALALLPRHPDPSSAPPLLLVAKNPFDL